MDDTLATTLPLAALDMALQQRRLGKLLEPPQTGVGAPAPVATRAEAKAAVFEWIEIFYNRERFHSALGFKSPVDFATNLN